MKRIVMSLSAIVFVAALAYGATGAFFSDTETSAGNTFTAGSIDLTVDSTSHYNNAVCAPNNTWQLEADQPATSPQYPIIGSPCSGTWTATDLGAQNQFFNFADIKPGDQGEDTVSLHVATNNAWACMDIGTNANNENGANEPEIAAGDTVANGPTDGELAQALNFVAWLDNASTGGAVVGDNIHQASEPLLFGPTAAASLIGATTSLPLADATTPNGPLAGNVTNYVGVAWCAGTITVNGDTGAISCDGSSMGNNTQTDSATSTIAFRVEQSRNNANFTCAGEVAPPNPNEINQADLATSTADVIARPTSWFFYNDTNDTIMTIDQFTGTGGQNHMDTIAGEQGAKMTLDTGVNPRYNIASAQFGGTLLSAITALNFRVYDNTADSDTPFIQFNVDFSTSTIAGGFQSRLTMQPGSSTNAPLAPATWTTVDAINGGNAMWTWSGYANGPDKSFGASADNNTWPDGNTNEYRTWNSIVAAFPNAKFLTPGSFFGVRDGQPGPAGATDYVSSIQLNGTTYDFQI